MQKSIATVLSYLFHPIFIPFFLVVLLYFCAPVPLYFVFFNPKTVYGIFILVLLYATVVPLLLVFMLKKYQFIDHLELFSIADRNKVLMVIISVYIALAFFLYNKGIALKPLSYLFMSFIFNMVGLVLFNKYLKISLHMAAVCGALGIISSIYFKYHAPDLFSPLIIIILLAGIIGSARLFLEQHNIKEISFGSVWGLFSGFIISYFLI